MKAPPPIEKRPDWLMSRNTWLQVYQTHPMALATHLAVVMGPIENEQDRAVHNFIMEQIGALCPNQSLMLRNVARAIIKTAVHTGGPD